MRIAVVHDLNPTKDEEQMIISVLNALKLKYDAVAIPFDENFIKNIRNVDFVFNLSTHGGKETRQIHVPAILDYLGIPYTGPSAYTHSVCMNKGTTKIILQRYSIPTPEFMIFDIGEFPEKIDVGKKYIVKPIREGSAKGLTEKSVVDNIEDMTKAIKKVHSEFEQAALVEEFIDGMELSVGLVGNFNPVSDLEVLPILEIDFSTLPEGLERFYSYRVKHLYGEQTNYVCPARINQEIEEKIKEYAMKIFKILNLRDYARMDLRVKNDEIYFLEVNSMPMLIPVYSDILKMANAKGFSYDEFIIKIFETACKRISKKG
ncbi:MAG: D-alanine-D-alanine ligase [Thermotogaceae bacterium]|jgi:D-alanine-D-alanine ligase|nr:D-alanine-D-alanine ligase [Thermotogaceae bacterium]